MSDKLLIGRIAFAKSICFDWVFEHTRIIVLTLASSVVLLFGFFHWIAPSVHQQKLASWLPAYYADFSKTTASIQKGQWAEALTAARALHKLMKEDLAFWDSQDKMIRSGDFLYAYNLIRIAALEKEVGTAQGELAALDEMLSHLDQVNEAWSLVGHSFQDGTISLQDYIQQRKQALTD